ncbi:hypothetical protein CERSUDRAFT_77546 [Gelatoporia subvermispora B]|uniref:Uncharacterized protein n=1 Tax=Ceriporiopsis subvermispora (strain B) TaxID=914234 RepID=M2P9U3_CERS8|nr:hypothetical protein CERSUDRAFT_77546 [Gelatoporia subvermispora B]
MSITVRLQSESEFIRWRKHTRTIINTSGLVRRGLKYSISKVVRIEITTQDTLMRGRSQDGGCQLSGEDVDPPRNVKLRVAAQSVTRDPYSMLQMRAPTRGASVSLLFVPSREHDSLPSMRGSARREALMAVHATDLPDSQTRRAREVSKLATVLHAMRAPRAAMHTGRAGCASVGRLCASLATSTQTGYGAPPCGLALRISGFASPASKRTQDLTKSEAVKIQFEAVMQAFADRRPTCMPFIHRAIKSTQASKRRPERVSEGVCRPTPTEARPQELPSEMAAGSYNYSIVTGSVRLASFWLRAGLHSPLCAKYSARSKTDTYTVAVAVLMLIEARREIFHSDHSRSMLCQRIAMSRDRNREKVFDGERAIIFLCLAKDPRQGFLLLESFKKALRRSSESRPVSEPMRGSRVYDTPNTRPGIPESSSDISVQDVRLACLPVTRGAALRVRTVAVHGASDLSACATGHAVLIAITKIRTRAGCSVAPH